MPGGGERREGEGEEGGKERGREGKSVGREGGRKRGGSEEKKESREGIKGEMNADQRQQ